MSLSSAVFVSVIQSLADGVIVTDHDGIIRVWNRAAENMFGYDASERIGQRLSAIIPDRYHDAHWTGFRRLADTGRSRLAGRPVEVMARHKNGREIPVELTVTPWLEGDQSFIVGILRDISGRRSREQALREAEQRFSLIAEQTQDVITYANDNGLIEYVSPAVTTILGYAQSEIIGKNYDAFFHPDDLRQLHNYLVDVVTGLDVSRFTSRMLHRAGHYVWFDTTIKLKRDASGLSSRWLGISRDITAQRKLTDQLNRAVRIAGLGHFDWDIVRGHIDWSESLYSIYGFDKQQILTVDLVRAAIHPEDAARYVAVINQALETGAAYETEARIVRPDGSTRHLLYQGETVKVDERVVRLYGTIQDVTEKKEVEKLLIESEKLAVVGQLAAGIAHEIRNPMTVIKGFTQLLQGDVAPHKAHYIDVMLHELTRVDSVLSELLVLAKPQVSTMAVTNIDPLLQEVAEFLEPEALKAGVQVVMTSLAAGCVLGDVNQLKQVFINVLLNAIEAMPEGGRVFVQSQIVEGNVVIHIRDEGMGMEPARLKKTGEPFYTTKEKGTGLGLMVCRKIIALHQGVLQIESTMGSGTVVRITMPAAQAFHTGSDSSRNALTKAASSS